MNVLKLVSKNLLRHKLRSLLTVLGIAVAVLAFGLLRTVVTSWSAGVEASSANRLITRHAVSFIFPLPVSYKSQIASIPGVTIVSNANWFQGIYKDQSFENFFPRLAVDPETIFKVYPEYLIPDDQLANFQKQRNSCVIGEKLAKQHSFKIGDIISVKGDIYPGDYEFTVAGIYKGKDKTADETQMFFHWDYLNERSRQSSSWATDQVGWYIIQIGNMNDAASVSEAVDALYTNSAAKTKTETEQAFQQSFVSLSGAIITSLELVSYVIIGIILMVLANTIIMSARERIREYAVLKTLGFTNFHVVGLIAGESLFISMFGGAVGLLLAFPVCEGFGAQFPTMFPVFKIAGSTIAMAIAFSVLVGVIASIFPSYRSANMKIVDGLRQIG
ncbi:MAG: ABC transporter permease [Bacteroidetes bacterium]|jgi:putative ABC transport system permease protein|nr:ABC transporter permease [Bacteroidota bacterium]